MCSVVLNLVPGIVSGTKGDWSCTVRAVCSESSSLHNCTCSVSSLIIDVTGSEIDTSDHKKHTQGKTPKYVKFSYPCHDCLRWTFEGARQKILYLRSLTVWQLLEISVTSKKIRKGLLYVRDLFIGILVDSEIVLSTRFGKTRVFINKT